MGVTFVLTMLIALQYAVLVGVGISMILYIIQQSNRIVVRQRLVDEDGNEREVDGPAEVLEDDVIVLQPYGSLFFASAPVFEEALPTVVDGTRNSVVILRLRGRDDLGSTFTDVLLRYAKTLKDADSKLMILSHSDNVNEQLAVARVTNAIDEQNIYASGEWVGKTLNQAYVDANEWVNAHEREPDKDPDSDHAGDGKSVPESDGAGASSSDSDGDE